MANSNSKVKKETYKDRFLEKNNSKYSSISNFYYLSMILINICSLVIAWLLLANGDNDIASFSDFFELFKIENYVTIIVLFIVVLLLKTLISYLKLYSKGNKSKFYATYSAISRAEYYNSVSIYGKTGDVVLYGSLAERKIKENVACDVAYSKKIFEKIAFIALGIVVLIWSLFMMEKISIWYYFLTLLVVIWNGLYIGFIFLTKKNKTKGIAIVAKFCKILYDIKLIKDYEKTFNKMVDSLLIYSNSFNYGKVLVCVELASNLLSLFIKFMVVHLAMANLVLTDSSMLGEVIIKCFIIESVFAIFPLPKGVLIYELLFISLFASIIPNGFVFYVMLIYRFYDIFMNVINYLLIIIVDSIVYRNKKIAKNKNESIS